MTSNTSLNPEEPSQETNTGPETPAAKKSKTGCVALAKSTPESAQETAEKYIKKKKVAIPKLRFTSTIANVSRVLQLIHQSYGKKDNDWHIAQQPCGFASGEIKSHWTLPEDPRDISGLGTFVGFIKAPWPPQNTSCKIKIGFMITWEKSKVGKTTEHVEKADWHAWAAIIRRELPGGGQDLTIWDCNWAKNQKLKGSKLCLLGSQRALITQVRKAYPNLTSIWIGGKGNTKKGECMQLTSSFIQKTVRPGETASFPPYDGMRDAGYARINDYEPKHFGKGTPPPQKAKTQGKTDSEDVSAAERGQKQKSKGKGKGQSITISQTHVLKSTVVDNLPTKVTRSTSTLTDLFTSRSAIMPLDGIIEPASRLRGKRQDSTSAI